MERYGTNKGTYYDSRLVTTLQSQYDVDQTECEEQVTAFLNQLIEEGLIIIEE